MCRWLFACKSISYKSEFDFIFPKTGCNCSPICNHSSHFEHLNQDNLGLVNSWMRRGSYIVVHSNLELSSSTILKNSFWVRDGASGCSVVRNDPTYKGKIECTFFLLAPLDFFPIYKGHTFFWPVWPGTTKQWR